jgi:hypothetical protein
MGVSRAQNGGYDPAQVEREIQRLERLLELQRQVEQQQSQQKSQKRGSMGQPVGRLNQEQNNTQSQTSQRNRGNQASQAGQRSQEGQGGQGGQTQQQGRWYQGQGSPSQTRPANQGGPGSPGNPRQGYQGGQGYQGSQGYQGGQGYQGYQGGQGGQGGQSPSYNRTYQGQDGQVNQSGQTTLRIGSGRGSTQPRQQTQRQQTQRQQQYYYDEPTYGYEQEQPGTTAPRRIMLKTNLLYDIAVMTPNLGIDLGLGQRTSLGLLVGYNNWHNLWEMSTTGPDYDPKNKYLRKFDHTYARLEFKYWLRQRFSGHSLGVYAFTSKYKTGEMTIPLLTEKRFEYSGNSYGGGISYGYLWEWGPRWGMEFTLGAGVMVAEYDKSAINIIADTGSKPAAGPGYTLGNATRHRKVYAGPTSIGVNIIMKL